MHTSLVATTHVFLRYSRREHARRTHTTMLSAPLIGRATGFALPHPQQLLECSTSILRRYITAPRQPVHDGGGAGALRDEGHLGRPASKAARLLCVRRRPASEHAQHKLSMLGGCERSERMLHAACSSAPAERRRESARCRCERLALRARANYAQQCPCGRRHKY